MVQIENIINQSHLKDWMKVSASPLGLSIDVRSNSDHDRQAIFRAEYNTCTLTQQAIKTHYIETVTYVDTNRGVNDIIYYDNFGRKIQKVNMGASPTGKDWVFPIIYDNTGRITRQYLPYAKGECGNWRVYVEQEQNDFYQSLYGNNPCAYSDVVYDNSPEDQIIEQSSPGASWQLHGGHTTRMNIRKNTTDDHVKWYLPLDSMIILMGDYPAGALSVKQNIDPEDKECFEYYDSEGHLIAKEIKTQATDRHITYYVYNEAGRLSHIIPPALDKQIVAEDPSYPYVLKRWGELSKYCYYMEYDKYGRIYKQYVPGAGYTINLYDKRGRLALSQDAVMRSKSPEEWAFTKYDIFDRPVISGICKGTEADHVAALAAQTVFGEEKGTVLHWYTNQTYPTDVTEDCCLNITYYDDYNWMLNNPVYFSASDALGQKFTEYVQGQVTGVMTKVLGIPGNQWLLSATYYDTRYRTIQQVSQLYPSGMEVTTNVHDFAGNVTRVKVKQTVGDLVTEYNRYYSYDHRGRLLKVEQQMTGDPQGKVTLAAYTYDELGRQTGKNLHNHSYATTYAYQVGGSLSAFHSKDLTYVLSYDTVAVPVNGAVAKYDGNISCLRWKNNGTPFKSYTYAYDAWGQLTDAVYNEQNGSVWSNSANKFNVNGIGYDLNGNLKSLVRRNSSGGVLHNLVYNYDLAGNGNALSRVTLNGSASGTFVYDKNGNLTTDGQRGINIRYNELNLPEEINKGSEKILYIYSASGKKLAMQAGSSLTYYRDVMVYNGNTLSYVLHPEGIIRKSATAWVYDYMLSDHTGSTRVVLEANGNALSPIQTTDYYPFGLSFTHNNLDKNRYLFSGKELQDGMLGGSMLGWYDFGARQYNPVLGRWFCQDPALQLVSPYGFCGNNPVYYRDADGKLFGVDDLLLGLGIAIGAYLGGAASNDMNFNPGKWAWKSGNTWAGIMGGAFIGGMSVVNVNYGLSLFSKSASGFSDLGILLRGISFTTQSIKYMTMVTSFVCNFENAGKIFMGQFALDPNRSFAGQLLQATSRVTWEGIQTWAGNVYSNARNTSGKVSNVEIFNGATLVNQNNEGDNRHSWGMTLGNYINGYNLEASIDNKTFMHEYGHTLQGMRFGPLYVFGVGIPSLGNEIFNKDTHSTRWYEIQANRYASYYFRKHYGIEWDKKKHPLK